MRRREATAAIYPQRGFSLLELLVCIAIIGILASMYMSTLTKALRQARKVVAAEGIRQENMGRFADTANIARNTGTTSPDTLRERCRAAYRQSIPLADSEVLVTETLYCVRTAAEFQAYWHTLINPENDAPLEFADNGSIVVRDESGNAFSLRPTGAAHEGSYPTLWEFLTTDLANTTVNGLGINVLYNDGHVEYVRYPSAFPACSAVATLSQRFIDMTSKQQ